MQLNEFNNITDFTVKFGGKTQFNYNEKTMELVDDSSFTNIVSDIVGSNLNTKHVNINTLRGLKDLSGTTNANVTNAMVFTFNNSYDTRNAAKLFSSIRKLNKLTDNTVLTSGPSYKQLLSELNKYKIYPQKGLLNKNNWILFYINDKQIIQYLVKMVHVYI